MTPPISSTSCADLERLAAAAAATMGCSSETVQSPQIINAHINGNFQVPSTCHSSTALIPHYSSDAYDLSRTQQYATVRVTEYPSKAFFDQTKNSHSANHQTISLPNTIQTSSKIASHFAVIERCDQSNIILPRVHTFNQSVMAAKNVNLSNLSHGGSNVHYIPLDTRSVPNSSDTVAIAVSQGGDIQVANGTQVNSQQIIQIVTHPQSHQHYEHQQTFQSQSSSLGEQRMPQLQAVSQPLYQSFLQEEPGEKEEKTTEKVRNSKRKAIKKVKLKKNDECELSDESEEQEHAKINMIIPDPTEINGKKYYVCQLCSEKFVRKYLYKRHQICHTGEKRGALSLETKVEIIKRIKNGERQVDLAMEYNVGRSTLSFIMKNAEKFLGILKNGKFHPESKRLRGAQREDVEAALYEWYRQASHIGMAISGPILCRKARDFAAKLGYQEFKATHGWLDRFKRRKNIVLGRSKILKLKGNEEDSEEFKEDFSENILPNTLVQYESNDVFHASEIGLLYRVFPSKALQFKGTRCAGGINSKKRITVLICTNMTGSEKFPLLVTGKHAKPKCFKNVKSLPVQYLSNDKSWMTKESYMDWLKDLNSWFVQQNRKILLVVPHLPIHLKSPKLSAVKVIVTPSNFVGPSKLGISYSLKRNYRRAILETFLSQIEENLKLRKKNKKQTVKFSLLTCLHKLAAAWHAVTDVTIGNSFRRSALGKYCLWNTNTSPPENTLGTENLDLLHRLKSAGVKVPNSFTFDDFVTFDDEVQVCHFMDDDDIIASVTGVDIESSDSDDDVREEMQDTEEDKENEEEEKLGCPSFAEVKRNLKIIEAHISHQTKGVQEMFGILSHLEYLLHRTRDGTEAKETHSSS